MSVEENLLLGAYARGRERSISGDLERTYDLFPRLRERRLQRAGTLSGGEQQMLATGRALMGRPRLLCLDEPTMGLSPALADRVFELLRELNADGTTIFIVEQNAAAALAIAHRGYVLRSGEIVLSGSSETLLADEALRDAYLGEAT
jgi:branched-chain amino acid transport system ATP-binding protein